MKNLLILFILVLTVIGCGVVLEEDISNKTITTLSPVDTVYNAGAISFWWDNLEGARNYELRIVTPSFDNPRLLLIDTIITSNSLTFNFQAGQYEWELRGYNAGYTTDYVKGSFQVDTVSIPINLSGLNVNLQVPKDNDTVQAGTVKFWWDQLAGADNYELIIVTPTFDNVQNLIFKQSLTTDEYDMSLDSGKYQWSVKAVNSTSESTKKVRTLYVSK